MRVILFLVLFISCIGSNAFSQCSDPLFQGYNGSNKISVSEAFKVFSSDLAGTTNCNIRFPLRSLHLMVSRAGEVLLDMRINGRMSADEKKKLFKTIKPGVTILLDEIKVGADGKYIPGVTFLLQ